MSKEKLSSDSTEVGSKYPWWISIAVMLGALLLASGAVISKVDPSLLANGDHITAATRVFADYTFARDLPLAFMLLFLLAIRARRILAGVMVLIALIQILDMINDLVRGDFLLVPVVLAFAIVFLVGASKVFGQPVWHVDPWREPDSRSPESH